MAEHRTLDRIRKAADTAPPAPLHQTVAFDKALKTVRKENAPTLLHMLKPLYQQREQTPRSLAALTGITKERIAQLANSVGQQEPWLHEAAVLARALGCGGIVPLITTGDLADVTMGFALDADVDAFRAGIPIPLSLACRLAVRFGLDDPLDLVVTARQLQLWSVMEASERNPEASGWCPWCAADRFGGEDHRPTCLPNNLWAPRDSVDPKTLGYIPRPKTASVGTRGFSKTAHGVKALRAKLCKTQGGMARDIGTSTNYLARIEQGNVPLTLQLAERIAAAYHVTVESIYAPPPGVAPVARPRPDQIAKGGA